MKSESPVPAYRCLVDGQAVAALDGAVLELRCPSDGALIGTIPAGSAKDIGRAVAAARSAFERGRWSRIAAVERGRVLVRWATLVLDRIDELADIEAMDTGKPTRQARADIATLARYLEFYAGAVDKLGGETFVSPEGFSTLTLREPLGVVGVIVPWNYPAQIFGRAVSPALAMGNSVVVKPAEEACLSVLRVASLATEAGLPAGVLNVVSGLGHVAGAALTAHPDVDFVSFTGSPQVGSQVQASAGAHHAAVTLELGGKSPHIVFDDADIERMLQAVVNGIVQNAGQTCSAGSRVLVQRSAWERVVPLLAERFGRLQADHHLKDGDLGPLISSRQLERVQAMVDRALRDGAHVVARGGVAPAAGAAGYYFAPVLIAGAAPDSEIAREEVFGPVLVALPFEDEEEAVALANNTDYGLIAAVWTRDIGRALRVMRRLRAGQVFVNSYGAGGGVELPFGGVRKSGHGREKGMEALREVSALKTVVIDHH